MKKLQQNFNERNTPNSIMKDFTPNFIFKKLHHIQKKLHGTFTPNPLFFSRYQKKFLHETLTFLHLIRIILLETNCTFGLPYKTIISFHNNCNMVSCNLRNFAKFRGIFATQDFSQLKTLHP